MKRLFLLSLLLTGLRCGAQQAACPQVYSTVDIAASYQYGNSSLTNFKTGELTPLLVACAGTGFDKLGSLYLLLTIDSTGQVREVDLAQGNLSDDCKARLRSRVLAMQGWKPATLSGRPVCSRFRWPVGALAASVRGLGSLNGVDTLPRMRMAGTAEPPKPLPVDSIVSVGKFDLSRFAAVLPPAEKRRRVVRAMKQAFGESSVLFLKNPCLTLDSASHSERPLKQPAPDCRLNDFYFIDLDKDGDLDLVYHSTTDQYLGWGSNRLFLFRNEGKTWTTSSLEGYLYSADFSKWADHTVLFKTVARPSLPGGSYRFFSYRLHTGNWNLLSTGTSERPAALVQER